MHGCGVLETWYVSLLAHSCPCLLCLIELVQVSSCPMTVLP
jgi:hypothetical protein